MDALPGMPAPAPRPTATAADYPHRIRVWGGRVVHAAREVTRSSYTHATACDQAYNHRAGGAVLPDTAAVTCTACQRATNTKEN